MVSLQHITIPLFLNSDKDKGFLFNFQQQHEAFKNTDTRCFKIQISNMGPQAPPPYPPPPTLPGRASVADASFYSEKAKN